MSLSSMLHAYGMKSSLKKDEAEKVYLDFKRELETLKQAFKKAEISSNFIVNTDDDNSIIHVELNPDSERDTALNSLFLRFYEDYCTLSDFEKDGIIHNSHIYEYTRITEAKEHLANSIYMELPAEDRSLYDQYVEQWRSNQEAANLYTKSFDDSAPS